MRITFDRFEDYRAATARDKNSLVFDDHAADPFFRNAATDDFALKPDSSARNVGKDLPKTVADAIGVGSRYAPNLGALLLPGGGHVTNY